jgi:hypothetical protein
LAKQEFKKLVSGVFNKPIRKRRRKILVKPAPAENLQIDKKALGVDDLMPNFNTSCDFIFSN